VCLDTLLGFGCSKSSAAPARAAAAAAARRPAELLALENIPAAPARGATAPDRTDLD